MGIHLVRSLEFGTDKKEVTHKIKYFKNGSSFGKIIGIWD